MTTTAAPPRPAAEQADEEEGERTRRALMEPSKTAVALASSIVALLVSIPTGIYTIWPALSPDPKEKVGSTLETIAFDRNVTLAEYRERVPYQQVSGRGGLLGNVFYIRATIEGFKREELRVRWFTYEAAGGAANGVRVRGLGSSADLEQIFRPQAPINTQVAEVWVPTPTTGGEYFVRFHLYAKDGVLLSFVDSEVFVVERL